MPTTLERINADLITVMKDRDPENKEKRDAALLTLRTLLSEVKTFQVNNRRDPDEGEIAAILQKGIKQFRETLDRAAGRNEAGVMREDIVEREKAKVELYEKYLPQQLGRAEIAALVDEALAATGASSAKDMGLVMGFVRPKVQGRADGRLVSEVVKEKLGGGN